MDQEWPNLFVVGAPRAGTTSLWSYLGQHPEIFMSRVKEPRFFSTRPSVLVPKVTDQAAYLELFAGSGDAKFRGEASATYLGDPAVPPAIARVSPGAKIIAVLREPIDRAYSAYWMGRRYGVEARPFLDAVKGELEGLGWPDAYVGHGLYADAVERYQATYGENFYVVFFDDLAGDVRGAVGGIYEFLGVDPGFASQFDATIRNPTGIPRNAIVRRMYSSRILRTLSQKLVPDRLHARVADAVLEEVERPPIEPEARELLQEVFEPDRDRLERVLHRPVPWNPS